MFTGTYTAIITPFRDRKLDEVTFARLLKAQVRAGIDGIVPVGSTGESPTLDYEEHVRVIELAVEGVEGRAKVLAGSGANSTSEAIYLTKAAEQAGADGSLQVTPYYNKPTQEGLFQHFRAVARATRLPIVLYNIPSRSGIEIAIETVVRLAKECANVVGIKESGGNPDRVSQLHALLGAKFVVLSGDDSMTLPFIAVGAQGVISVASNIIPRPVGQLVRAARAGDMRAARRVHLKYFPLFKDLFLESNPVPVKAAAQMLGLASEDVRLPLVPLAEGNRARLRRTLLGCGVLQR